ncbi:MAG: diacylglycerol kinase family protein [Solirubrobacterales bacterium]
MSEPPPGPYLLLVNPSAGGGRVGEILPRATAAMDAAGLEYRTVMTTGLEHGCDEATAAAAQGMTPVVISGDGLIGQIGGALAGTGATMGVIPGGRGNDFARVLGIPDDPAGAVAALAGGASREIDVGDVNGRRFLCIASCGFDSDANRIANEARFIRGQLVYAYAALRALIAWKPATFTITLDGRRRDLVGYSVAAANSRAYGGGMFIAPDAELDDGLLDVVTTAKVGKLRFLVNLPKVFSGKHVENPEVSVSRAAEVLIEADRPFAVYADGEHLADLPATVRLLPRALRVIVPG